MIQPSNEFFKRGEVVECTDDRAASKNHYSPNLKKGQRFTVVADTADGRLMVKAVDHGLEGSFYRYRFSRVAP